MITLDERKHPLAECSRCPWNAEGKFVPSLIPKGVVKLTVLGEAPGSYEAKTGIPFTGPSGELLDRVLEHHGFSRKEVAFVNTAACRPPGKTEKPPKTAVAACATRLDADLKQANAPLILAVGATSAQTLLGDSRPISKLRVGGPRDTIYGPVISSWHPAYCVAPETRILTSDLRWVKAEEIKVDDELIGFDETLWGTLNHEHRKLRRSIVTNVAKYNLPCYKITTDFGSVISSSDHMWLSSKSKISRNGNINWSEFDWVKTENMYNEHIAGKSLKLGHYVQPWSELNTRNAGYIAGFLDGEGTVGHSQVSWSQNEGPTSENMLKLVTDHGFNITKNNVSTKGSIYERTGTCKRFFFKGKKESIKALGMFRPMRLLATANRLWEGKSATSKSKPILNIEFLGNREVIAIATTTKTYIAEGYLSHNCLRTADAFPSFVKDVGKLNGDLPEPWKLPQYKVFEDPRVALVALNRLLGVKRAVIDIEAASDKDIDDAHPEDYDLLCVGVAYAQGQAVVFGPKIFLNEECLNVFSKFLDTVPIDAWNGKFDLLGLTPLFGMKKLSRDGMLMSYCVDERPRQHGLKMRGVEDLGTPKYDEDIAQYTKGKDGSFANIPKDLLYKYNAYDVCVTWDEIDYLELRMSPEQHRLHSFLIDAANMLMHVEMSPLHFDLEYNEQLSQEYMELLVKSEAKINSHVGYDINPRSPMQIMQFFALNGMNIPTTEREFLEKIQPQCDEHISKFIELLLENRKLTKTHGTYIKGLRKKVKDGRIRTTFSLHATTSGRLASRKPNLQNVDRRSSIRNQFTAGPGLILVQGDFSQIEGRVIAFLSQDKYLQGVFSDPNVDIFNNMCNQIWGAGNWDKENRVAIKSIFYGFAYGRQSTSIAHELKKPVSYAQNLMNEFKSLIPEVVAWQAAIRREVLEEQFLTTPFGRKRTFHLITNDNVVDVLNEALSYKPQSIASDICLRAAIRLQPMLEKEYDAYMKLLVHDAIVVECVPEVKDLVINTMRREMIRSAEEFTDFVPFAVDFSSGYRLGEL